MSLQEIINQTKSSRLHKRLQNILAKDNSADVDGRTAIIDECNKAVRNWARNTYRIRLLFSILTLGLYPLVHLIVTSVGRRFKNEKYQNIPLNCTQVPWQQAQFIIDKFEKANNDMLSQQADITVTPESTDVQSSAIEESSSEPATVSTFCQVMKDIEERDGDGVILSHVVEYLDPQDCQRLGKIAYVAGLQADKANLSEDDWAWSPMLVAACRDQYLRKKAPEHALALRDHVMSWEYDEAKALATMNPYALMIACDYKNNQWQDDDKTVSESALDHAWRTGDENFIELFEELGRDLPLRAFANKETLLDESEATRATIAGALQKHAAGGSWDDLWEIYQHAPQWVFGLDYYIYKNRDKITNEEIAAEIDIISVGIRQCFCEACDQGVGLGWDVSHLSGVCGVACIATLLICQSRHRSEQRRASYSNQ